MVVFTVAIFMYQAQLINTEILNDKIKLNNKYNWTHIYVFSGRRNQYTNTNAIYIMVVMQLSVFIDCPFLIATFSSVYINLLHD
jgi:hypothetical protein